MEIQGKKSPILCIFFKKRLSFLYILVYTNHILWPNYEHSTICPKDGVKFLKVSGGAMARRKRRKKRRATIHVTPLGYFVLGVLACISCIGIYFILWSAFADGEEKNRKVEATPLVEAEPQNTFLGTVSQATPTLPPIVQTPVPAPTPVPTATPVVTPTPSPGMANDVRMPTKEQEAAAVDGELMNSGVAMRKGPDSGYEIVDKYSAGTKLKIFDVYEDYYFCQTLTDKCYGYIATKFVSRQGLLPGEAPTPVPASGANLINGVVTATKVALRSVPTTQGNDPIGTCNRDCKLWIFFETNGFYYVELVGSGEKGYVHKDYVNVQGQVPQGTPIPG